jgi:hypothetical protein
LEKVAKELDVEKNLSEKKKMKSTKCLSQKMERRLVKKLCMNLHKNPKKTKTQLAKLELQSVSSDGICLCMPESEKLFERTDINIQKVKI